MDLIKIAEQAFAGEKKEFPAFKAGDQITVAYRIKEGNKELLDFPLFVLLRVDACGALEVTAEIGSSGETELICHLFDGLFRMLAYHTFCLIRDIVLDPLQWSSAVIICTENL